MNASIANNLQWIRLAVALQVVLRHTASHLHLPVPPLLGCFPGIPVFFFLSGFLVYDAFLRQPGWPFFRNRIVRIFPALAFVTLGSLAIILSVRGFEDLSVNGSTYLVWLGAQLTIGQAYNPDIFRDVGVGVINGALWTITTLLLFYLIVPVVVWLERRFSYAVIVLTVLSFMIYAFGNDILPAIPIRRDRTLYDLLALTPVVWGWMFGFGILAARHFHRLKRVLRYAPLLLIPLVIMIETGSGPMFAPGTNNLGLAYFLCYAGLVLWLAYEVKPIRRGPDLSYGLYLWHMPMVNLAIVLAVPFAPVFAIGMTVLAAWCSWVLVERPAAALRRGPGTPRSVVVEEPAMTAEALRP